MIDYLKEAEDLENELIQIRRSIHMNPELGNHEFHTAELVEKYLRSCGIQTERLLDTAVIGTLYGASSEKTAAFRADMDALPITEETALPFASVNPGVMHACGHDIHTAALLGSAKMLSQHADDLQGNVRFIFQPDEEGDGGADRLVKAGVMDDVDAVFGCHINPELAPGKCGIKYGNFYASACMFNITVRGKGAHGAEPEKGIDPIYSASLIAQRLKKLTGIHNAKRAVVTVGTFHAGTARNIIPDTAELKGIIRAQGIGDRNKMKILVEDAVHVVEDETGVQVDLDLIDSYPGVTNDDIETDLVKKTAENLLGKDNVIELEEPTMTTEDFGFYLLQKPGCFYHIGVGCEYPLHSAKLNPDESAIAKAAALHAAVLTAYLNRE